MSTPYEYEDESGLRVALEPTPAGIRVRLVSGALGAVLDLTVPAAERLLMGLTSALTRGHGRPGAAGDESGGGSEHWWGP